MSRPEWKPWHQVVRLRDELKNDGMSLSVFAADLYDVLMGKARPVYQNPYQFFSFTFPTYNLRELAKDVALRLAGKNDKAVRQLELTYGGGKTHTLITLYHLTQNPAALPTELAAVQEFLTHIGQTPPKARIAVLAFDKLDVEVGMSISAPNGETRLLKHPWSILAYQIAGDDGLRMLHAEGKAEERETPPAENLLVTLLSLPQKEGMATLLLIDEVLMYVRNKVGLNPIWRSRLIDFFQYLTQAATKVPTCAIVASLLAMDPRMNDETSRELTRELYAIFRREREEAVQPVLKEDVAEVLRRRFFEPDSIRDQSAFRKQIVAPVQGIAALDERTAKNVQEEESRFVKSYPFHPDLTEVLYGKWTNMEGFQRARGVLRTFALALRDAEQWDNSPLVATNVFLGKPGRSGLSESARELTNIAETEEFEGKKQEWTGILEGELDKARQIQAEHPAMRYREVEQAVFSTFLHSQPVGQKAQLHDLMVLLGHTKPDKIELDKALRSWTDVSWFLDETEIQNAENTPTGGKLLPRNWRLGSRPNLVQMHNDARQRVSPEVIDAKLDRAIRACKSLTQGAAAAGAKVHILPEHPRDIEDDADFHYAILGPKAASSVNKPAPEAKRFIDEKSASGAPRVYRNAVVLAVTSLNGVDAARSAIRDHEGWLEVESQLQDQDIDNNRRQLLEVKKKAAEKLVNEMVRQAYTIFVAVNDKNVVSAYQIVLSDDRPLFTVIKTDPQARIKVEAVSAGTFLPEGPYDLWKEGDTELRVKDLETAFAQFSHLPRMLNRSAILDTLLQGCEQGMFVLHSTRADGSPRTYWFDTPERAVAAKDETLQVVLAEQATLSTLLPKLLVPDALPELWRGPTLTLQELTGYFRGRIINIKRKDGDYEYDDSFSIPTVERSIIEEAVAAAVYEKRLWLISGSTSLYGETVPADVLTDEVTLQAPPQPLQGKDVMPTQLPEAWNGKDETTALAIADALSTLAGKPLPWLIVRDAINTAFTSRWLERSTDSGPWPCDYAGARAVKISERKGSVPAKHVGQPAPSYEPQSSPDTRQLVAESDLNIGQLQEFSDQVSNIQIACTKVGLTPTFHLRIELKGDGQVTPEALETINTLLQEVAEQLKIG